MTEIVYEPHPVSAERMAKLREKGVKVIDAKFKPAEPKKAKKPKKDDE